MTLDTLRSLEDYLGTHIELWPLPGGGHVGDHCDGSAHLTACWAGQEGTTLDDVPLEFGMCDCAILAAARTRLAAPEGGDR